MFISKAYAQAAGDAAMATEQGAGLLGSLLPLLVVFLVFYFLVIRPQNRRFNDHKSMVDNLRRGDKVVTAGGIIATVKKVNDDEVTLEVAQDVEVIAVKSTIMTLRSKLEQPANSDSQNKKAS